MGGSGLEAAEGFLESAVALKNVRLSEEEVEKALFFISSHRDVIIYIQTPYSTAVQLVREDKLFYRWLLKGADTVRDALSNITIGLADFINRAFAVGASVVSLSDPYAREELLGEKRIFEFSCQYTYELLRGIGRDRGIVHLCPYSSMLLGRYGLLRSAAVYRNEMRYEDILAELSEREELQILGEQCINLSRTDRYFPLELCLI